MIFSLVPVLALLALSVNAQRVCNGVIDSPRVITSDVSITNAPCVLENVNITGSVTVSNGGSLSTVGVVNVFGSISGNGAGSMYLGGKLWLGGGFMASNSPTVRVGPQVRLGAAMLSKVGTFILQGTAVSVTSTGDGNIIMRGGTILGGGIARSTSKGSISLCGASIRGGISVTGITGHIIAAAGASCAPNRITGTIAVSKSTGDVRVSGSTLTGADLLLNEIVGDIDVRNARLSDLNVGQVTGGVYMDSVVADSDGRFGMISGPIFVTKSRLGGDFSIMGNNKVTVTGNDFGGESVNILGNKGPVLVTNNKNFIAIMNENTGLTFNNNQASSALISKNLGATSIVNNNARALSCTDNEQLSGRGNTAVFKFGQCSRL